MFDTLSKIQKQILNFDNGLVVAKACPGSGKTYSVTARIVKLINEKNFENTGIAAMSFTNIACNEIKEKLKNKYKVSFPLQYPHFLGTIDRFINKYIFLPHGHLIMECNKRPELIGKPHRSWTKGKGDRKYINLNGKRICTYANPHGYFDSTSFDINDELYSLVPAMEIHFSLKKDKYYKKDGKPKKVIQEVITAKYENFKLGYANQADANYIALKLLEHYPLITKAIANKFKYYIIDEAQDTDAIQMRIIELLIAQGANNTMLIGDRDQSIFEWNNADPALFDRKYSEWEKIELNENWRSSQNICNFTQSLSSFEKSFAVSPEVKAFGFEPTIESYKKNERDSMYPILSKFFANCEQNNININLSNVAVLYRGKGMAQYLGINVPEFNFKNSPWLPHQYYVKDIINGKILLELGDFQNGYHFIEKGYHEALYKQEDPNYHCSQDSIKSFIETESFINYRNRIFDFIKILPIVSGQNLLTWIRNTKSNFVPLRI